MSTARKEVVENSTTEIEKEEAVHSYENLVQEIKADASVKPAEYMADSIVPAGGE